MVGNNWKRIKSIWFWGKKYILIFLIAEICIIVSYAISVMLPLNLARLIDEVLYGKKYILLPEIIGKYISMFALSVVFNFIYAFVWQYLNNHYVLDIKNRLFEKIVYAKSSFLSEMNSGDMMVRIDGDSEQFIHVVQRNLFHFINSAIMCIGILILIVRINFIIAVMLITAAILPIMITRLCGKITEKHTKELCETTGSMNGILYEILKGFREIKIYCAESWATKKIFEPLKKIIGLENNIRSIDFFVSKGIDLVNLIITLVIYIFSAVLVLKGKISIGIFLAIVDYMALLHKKFNWMLRIYLDWFNRKVSIDRVNEILELESEIQEGKKLETISNIEFKDVDFAYENENLVLNNLHLKINKGEKVAIVGNSGNGKTTIISLLLGFYKVNRGLILINGIPISEINLESIRERIGVVSQDIIIFEDTVRYNLNWGREFTDEEIYTVLEKVNLLEIIKRLPNGIDTVISSSSYNLSGGQKQRLMIARMLLRRPDCIVMDEATSALDIETEKVMTECINNIADNTTLIIISHRPATIKNCDRIFVLNKYKIEDAGTHKELLKTSRAYAAMFGR